MKIAILGFGTVGRGAYEAAMRTMGAVEVTRILDIRTAPGFENITTDKIEDIVNDPEIELVIETMGGVEPAFSYVMAALKAKKHAVSANKQLISAKFKELTKTAKDNGVKLRYTASAGGGIPWLYNLRRSMRCDEINSVCGIVNGTTNFILDAMYTAGSDYEETLKQAQKLGYAEANPEADVFGYDAQRKCAISASIAFDTAVDEKLVLTEGIQYFNKEILAAAKASSHTKERVLKLMMSAGRTDTGAIYAYVCPCFVSVRSLEANVPKNFNLITLDAKYVGVQSYYGQGAGMHPTGTSVIQDVLDIMNPGGTCALTYAHPVSVDNDSAIRSFFVYESGTAYLKNESVKSMFAYVKSAREAGSVIFFAVIPQEEI